MDKVYIVEAVRTPFGSFLGSLKDIEVESLAAHVITEVVKRSKVDLTEVDAVHLGNCNTSESKDVIAPVIARQALLKAGLPHQVISSTIDKACCSGIEAIKRGYDSIRFGEADVVLAGGVQMMSQTPHIVRGLRGSRNLSNFQMEDCLFPPGYKDYNPVAVDAGEVAVEYNISREDQDQWAYRSQKRYQTADQQGKFEEEIMSITIKKKNRETIIFEKDEFPKPYTTLEGLSKLPTIYNNPTVTAGNAPGLNDGAAMLMLVSEKKVNELGLEPLAEIVTAASVADEPKNIPVVPALAIKKVIEQENIDLNDIQLIEINEAFAAVPLVSSKVLATNYGVPIEDIQEKININGGAIAIGHPLGASGARIVLTMMYELRRRGGGYGVAAICGGLAQGDALLIKV